MKITLISYDEKTKDKLEYSFEAGGLSHYEILNDHVKSFLLGAGWVFNPCSTIEIEEPDSEGFN